MENAIQLEWEIYPAKGVLSEDVTRLVIWERNEDDSKRVYDVLEVKNRRAALRLRRKSYPDATKMNGK